MEVSISAGTKYLNKNHISEYIQWLAIRLLGKRLAQRISIDIHCERLNPYEGGYTGNIDDSNIKPRKFEILLNKDMHCDLQMKVLAHEMVHIKQMARSQLRLWPDEGKWLGVFYPFNEETYHSLPWELEARMMEETLLDEYLAATGKQLKYQD